MDATQEYIKMVLDYAPAGVMVGNDRHGFLSLGNGKWRNGSGMEVSSSHVWVYWIDHPSDVSLGIAVDEEDEDLTEE